jgi:hypothetical protein
MRKSLEIKVNPNVLKTLRESSGYTVEEIAKKTKTTATKEPRPWGRVLKYQFLHKFSWCLGSCDIDI